MMLVRLTSESAWAALSIYKPLASAFPGPHLCRFILSLIPAQLMAFHVRRGLPASPAHPISQSRAFSA